MFVFVFFSAFLFIISVTIPSFVFSAIILKSYSVFYECLSVFYECVSVFYECVSVFYERLQFAEQIIDAVVIEQEVVYPARLFCPYSSVTGYSVVLVA